MLYKIPKFFTADFLKLIMEMGHGEELLICDANFPHKTMNKETVVLAGCDVAQILKETLEFFPLDQTVEYAAVSMDSARESGAYDVYEKLLAEAVIPGKITTIPRFDFYERAAGVAGIVLTSDIRKGGNIIIKKGVVNTTNYEF